MCSDFKSEHIVTNADGIMAATQRNIGKQRGLLEAPDRLVRFRKLLDQMPPGEMPAIGGEIDFKTIK
eukprot:11159311-Lingulodinium_polyedra.AAC.1